MDPVRFGRALGIGARLAAKTAVTVVDAALAPNPNVAPATLPPPANNPSPRAVPHQPAAKTDAARPPTSSPVRRPGTRDVVQAVSAPLRRLSGVLWLEFTGVFFGLFALTAAVGAWRLRNAWRATPANAAGHSHLLLTLAIALLFGYFCISSFLRARRRNQRP